MKRFLSICTLIFLSFPVWSLQINQSFSGKSCTTTINDEGLSYYFSIKQQDGGYTFFSPPVFSYNKNDWYLGELKTSGLFKQVLEPGIDSFSPSDTKSFQKVSSPALNPLFVGIGKSFTWGDIATIYPFGLFADIHNNKIYFASLLLNKQFENVSVYMPSWSEIESVGLSSYNILGFYDSFQRRSFTLKSSAFYRYVYRQSYGNSGTIGFNFDASFKDFDLVFYRNISNNSSFDPMNIYGYSIGFDKLKIGLNFSSYEKPVFGGTAQKKSIEMISSYKSNLFSISSSNKLTADSDTGKTGTSLYDIKFHKDNLGAEVKIGLNRIKDTPISVNKLDIKIECSNAIFCIDGAKFNLSLAFEEKNLRLVINQDKECSLTFSLII